MSEYLTAKTGGTSNSDAAAIEQSLYWMDKADISICSAPGKLTSDPSANKVTKMLLSARQQYYEFGTVDDTLTTAITDRYDAIVNGLQGTRKLPRAWLSEIPVRIREAARQSDHTASMLGERLQAEIYKHLFGFKLLDPGQAPANLGANPDLWRDWLNVAFKPGNKYIMPGNTTRVNGNLVTFSNGGSDTSSGHVARAIGAALNLNLTDGGAMSADPKLIVPNRLKPLDHLLYVEGRELGKNGTGLVHPDAMVPLMLGNIPTEIHSTSDPKAPYTTLDNDERRAESRRGQIVALSLMENVAVIRIHEPDMADTLGRLASFEFALADRDIGLIGSQDDGVDGQKYFVESKFAEEAATILQTVVKSGTTEKSQELSFITLVGYRLDQSILNNISRLALNTGIDARQWQAQDNHLSTGRHSLRISVNPDEAHNIFQALHHAFIELPSVT